MCVRTHTHNPCDRGGAFDMFRVTASAPVRTRAEKKRKQPRISAVAPNAVGSSFRSARM